MRRAYSLALTIGLLCCATPGRAVEPHWIWGAPGADEGVIDGLCLFQTKFSLDSTPQRAILQITCDDQYVCRLNERLVGVDEQWADIEQYDVTSLLREGENKVFVRARNLAQGPAGLWFRLVVETNDGQPVQVLSDSDWQASLQKSGTWNPDVARIKNWRPAMVSNAAPLWKDVALNETVAIVQTAGRSRGNLELLDGDRVLLLGNTVIEREQRYGYWEAALTSRYPDRNIVFRNLGWSGDTVWGEARARFGSQEEGFDHLEIHVHAVKPTLIICSYGSNAAFAGREGLRDFIEGYERLLDTLETTGATIFLLAPLKHEPVGGKLLSPTYNESLPLYHDAIENLAERRSCYFGKLNQDLHQPLTDNGVHLTELGYWATANQLEESLRLPPRQAALVDIDAANRSVETLGATVQELTIATDRVSFEMTSAMVEPPTPHALTDRFRAGRINSAQPIYPALIKVRGLPAAIYQLSVNGATNFKWTFNAQHLANGIRPPRLYAQTEDLMRAIRKKNELYFHRWRPQNETYLFLFRKHEQGNNAIEIPMFDPLVASVEKTIAQLRQPLAVKYEIKRK